jgi:hypothetical protein
MTWPSADRALDFFDAGVTRSASCGRNTMPTPYSPVAAIHALLGHFLAIELVRNLDQDTGTITLQRIGADGTR